MQNQPTSTPKLQAMTLAEYEAHPGCYRSIWDTERTDWPNWDQVRHRYMGKRTLLKEGALWVEGISFEIVETTQAPTQGLSPELLASIDAAFERLNTALDMSGALESPGVQKEAYALRLAIAQAQNDPLRVQAAQASLNELAAH